LIFIQYNYIIFNKIKREILQNATEFGKILRELMVRNNLQQGKLAKELEVSPAILSNYITGKNIPEMEFLAKCVNKFNLKNEEITKLFYSAFISAATNNQKVIVDTRFIDPTRIEMLTKVLAVLILYTNKPTGLSYSGRIDLLGGTINDFYNSLRKEIEFNPPLKNDT
jgi:predicted transcriptional regulator